jgi:ribonucleotide reductase alpha subunit
MFLDDTACNLASINLVKFLNEDGSFDIDGFKHAARIWTVVLEISVLMASFPSQEIAKKSYEFRTLGLGFANLGTILMRTGIPYASSKAYAIAGAISAIMCGESYATSAEMAKELGAFPGYERNKETMLRVRTPSLSAKVSCFTTERVASRMGTATIESREGRTMSFSVRAWAMTPFDALRPPRVSMRRPLRTMGEL